ncbi:type II toxin-antitoxin system HicA family toxin [Aliarcobacter cryaerophilus]|uniref:type II toxin-antitoxin system HicA family toxin n=1 Tax=Aliarcobacter cryaerophilus TaxID=28198 RepID=UPI00164AC9BE|nr:type II toxin-antitoxin system HicA family toxin [Aliarcobacter cryaerophilus]QNK85949.1 type II toxin-antitoxin system HicA family toxin [Aliarcobacter cryaerophilus]
MDSKEVLRRLKAAGFVKKSQKGSHIKLEKDNKVVILPTHGSKDIPIGTLKRIEKQSGIIF